MIKQYYVEYEELCKVRYVNGVIVLAKSAEEAAEKVMNYDFGESIPEILHEAAEDTLDTNIIHIEEVEE